MARYMPIVHYVRDEMELEVSARTESELRRFLSDFARSAGWTSTHTPANSRSPLSEPSPADVEGERPGPAAVWNMIDDFCDSVRPSARVNETQLSPRLRAVEVVPNNQHAIPLSIVVGPDEVILGLGHDGCRFELSANDAPNRSKIREILEAARNGRAEEETWRRSSECPGMACRWHRGEHPHDPRPDPQVQARPKHRPALRAVRPLTNDVVTGRSSVSNGYGRRGQLRGIAKIGPRWRQRLKQPACSERALESE
jgi:hypothetical protein